MEKALEQAVQEIHAICSKLPPVDAQTVLRFLPSRLEHKSKDVVTAWKADRAARGEAEMRKRDQLKQALEGMSKDDIAAVIKGVGVETKTAKTKAEVN